jgi:predicted DNA-binding transcriptional regulator AlpA
VSASPYLLVEDVAGRLHVAPSTVYEWARTGAVPHRKLPGSRRLLFLEAELKAGENGAELVVEELGRGGRVVKLKANDRVEP